MQDRYVGDIGDYGKYALLRKLCHSPEGETPFTLGVVWCLFPNENHNNDGLHISYLGKEHFRQLDPSLHDCLRGIVITQNRTLNAIAESDILPTTTIYFDKPTFIDGDGGGMPPPTQRVEYRASWLDTCLEATRRCDLVFFDPDNGIEVGSVSKRHPKAGKYIFWDELYPFVERGQSLVVYHHLNRTAPVRKQVNELARSFQERFPMVDKIIPLVFRRGSCRVFWIVSAKTLTGRLKRGVDELLRDGWNQHFEVPSPERH